MAEFANKRCEDSNPQLELMKRSKFFEEKEICTISKQMKNHEHKLQRVTKNKEDFLKYIQYLMDLVKLIKQRRMKCEIPKKESDIEDSIYHKVNNIYKTAIVRFKDDVRFYIAHITFCKHVKFNDSVNKTISKMLEVHRDKAKCWHIAAKWEMEENKNIKAAKIQIVKGIAIHPQSQLLYSYGFKIELDAANTCSGASAPSTTDENDISIKTERALAIYRSATKNVEDINFIIELLNIAKECENTQKLQNVIIGDMITKFRNKPQMWDTMARRELEGLTYEEDESMEIESAEEMPSLRDRIESCNEAYKVAVKRLKTETMWSLYINCLIEINQEPTLPNYKKKLLKNALMQANQAKKLQEKYYLHWIEMLENEKQDGSSKDKIYQVASFGTEAIPNSVSLWHKKLKHLMNSGKDDLVQSQFSKAFEILGANALPLWRMKLLYYQANFPEKIEEVFRAAVIGDSAISSEMKSPYLEWLVLTRGIEAARQKYKEFTIQFPTCLEIHKKMADLEVLQPNICVKNARKPHELAATQFGETLTEVWIDFMLFEMKYGDPKNSASIYQRAIKTLEPSKTDSFISEYSLIKAMPNALVN